MTVVTDSKFDIGAFLSSAGLGRQLVRLSAKQAFFSQGHPADSVFYLQIGRAKLTVVSESGKEATISMIAPGEFIGEESIASVPGLRLATATAVTACTALRIKRDEMIRVMHEHQGFSDLFVKFLLKREHETTVALHPGGAKGPRRVRGLLNLLHERFVILGTLL